jgi:hypothetical protein
VILVGPAETTELAAPDTSIETAIAITTHIPAATEMSLQLCPNKMLPI